MSSAFQLIEDTVLGSAAASITFNTGLSGYTKFRLTMYVIKDGTQGRIRYRLNGDTGANYSYERLSVYNTTAQGGRSASQTVGDLSAEELMRPSTSGVVTLEVSKPSASVPARGLSSNAIIENTANAISLGLLAHEWNNTADLISSISILASAGDFAIGTRAVLEGAA